MGTTIEDIQYEMFLEDEFINEIREKAVHESTSEKIVYYYTETIKSLEPVIDSMKNASNHLRFCPTSTIIYSGISQEFLLKNLLFKPLVFGLVNNELAAEIIIKYTFNTKSPFSTHKINDIVNEFTGFDFHTYRRKEKNKDIWTEMKELSEKRNRAVHDAIQYKFKEAQQSLKLVKDLYDIITNNIFQEIGIKVNKGIIYNI